MRAWQRLEVEGNLMAESNEGALPAPLRRNGSTLSGAALLAALFYGNDEPLLCR